MKYKKALVTGGAGFIGSHIAKKLVKMGIKVVVIDNLSMGNMKNVPPEADLVQGDILDKELVKKVLSGVDIVFHEAAVVSIRISTKEFYNDANNNLMGTL
ncbi:MAG: SDR family NAD(P)-dependent oxidoreductase, partial [Candidatus Omnitrophica bacterium]|nr:SDR family NAD(P)-dependent oxidoreductase [Candidatus Omnitrophota bacterium]